jgi:hypothetical protein
VRRIASVLGMLLLISVGCGTTANITLSHAPESVGPMPSTASPFGGVAYDLATMQFIRHRKTGNPADYGPDFPIGLLEKAVCDNLQIACYFGDLPISLAGDCLTLPLVLAGTFDKDTGEDRSTSTVVPGDDVVKSPTP